MTGRAILVTIGAVVLAVALFLGLFFATNIFSQKTANFRGETAKRNLIEANGAFRASAYDHFFNLCASVQGLEQQEKAQRELLAQTPQSDAYDRQRIQTNIAAIEGQRNSAIAQYNVDTRKGYTEGQFRADDLPAQLDTNAKETQCTA